MQQRVRLWLSQARQSLASKIKAYHNKFLIWWRPKHQSILRLIDEYWPQIYQYFRVHQTLVIITVFILANNFLIVHAADPSIASANYSDILSLRDPTQIASAIQIVSAYIPDVSHDSDSITASLINDNSSNFLAPTTLAASLPSTPDAAVPTPEPDPNTSSNTSTAKRSGDTKYTVQIGDTLSQISTKYGLKVATLQMKNSLANADDITPGQALIIPPADIAPSTGASSVASSTPTKVKNPISKSGRSAGYGFILPIHYTVIAQRLVNGHTGIDFDAPIGTPVRAAASGVVKIAASSGWNGGYGKTILVQISSNMTLRYGHLSSVQVRVGQTVSQGQQIALSGNTGRSTGPHLHFELRVNGVAKDPFP